MNYEIITIENPITGDTRHVVIDRGDGSFESFPVDEDNERFQAWVEAGGVVEPSA